MQSLKITQKKNLGKCSVSNELRTMETGIMSQYSKKKVK